jgi:uncharacterized protein YlxW (UPF0749 family)
MTAGPSAPATSGSENLSVALLVDLVTNTLDPGYAAAAARRGPDQGRHNRASDRLLAALGCLLVGFTLVLGYVSTHRAAPETAKVHTDLVSRVRSAEASDNKLDADAQQLSAEINSLRDQALAGSGALRTELQREQLLSGTIAVQGTGVQVQLADPPVPTASIAPGRKATAPITATQIITDRDVRSVVNQLWLDGAEAISVNNIRLTPTAAIRFAGEAVLVDFQPISEPYVIRAVGNADAMETGFAASVVASRYQTLAGVDGITFSFAESRRLTLPAATIEGLRYAHQAGAASALISSAPLSSATTSPAQTSPAPTNPPTLTSTTGAS